MVVCKFFLQGACKFGDKCRHEHPAGGRGRGGPPPRNNFQNQGFGNQPRQQQQQQQQHQQSNRFNSLDNRISAPGGPRGNARFGGNYVPPHQQSNQQPGQQPNQQYGQRGKGFQPRENRGGRRNAFRPNQYNITEQELEQELKERPEWIMSCFGPGKNAPVQLWGGEIEQSPEELRTLHYLALAQGNPQQTAQLEGEMMAASNQFFQNVLNDIPGAVDYIVSGENQHPNRHDETKFERHRYPLFSVDNYRKRRGVFEHVPRDQPNQGAFSRGNQGFNQPQSGNAGFGGASSTGFGGQPAGNAFAGQPQANAFGGQAAGVGFAQPPPFGTSGFGQQMEQSNDFGQPGQLQSIGQQQQQNGGFGQPDQPMSPMGGMTNAFQQPQQNGFNNSFQQPLAAQPFGQPQQPGNLGGFGIQDNSFGAQPASNPPNFGAAPGMHGQFPNNTTFGTPAAQEQMNASNGFNGQQNAFHNTSAQQGGFGQSNPNAFSQPNAFPSTASATGANPVKQSDGSIEDAYAFMLGNGTFRDGIMPETAPDARFIR